MHVFITNVCECLPKTYRSNKGHFLVCECLRVCTLQKHILAELLSYPSNICYEFGTRPEERCHMSESPDSPKQSNCTNAELHSGSGGMRSCSVGFRHVAISPTEMIAFHLCGLRAGSIFQVLVKESSGSPWYQLNFLLSCKSFQEALGHFQVVVQRVTQHSFTHSVE